MSAFVAWLHPGLGVSTGQGCAQRTAEGGRWALTRAEHRGTSLTPVPVVGLQTYLRPLWWSVSLRAIMEIRARGANRCSTASQARRVIGMSPAGPTGAPSSRELEAVLR